MAKKARLPKAVVDQYWKLVEECLKPDGAFDDFRGSLLHEKMTTYVEKNPLDPPAADQAYEVLERMAEAHRLNLSKGQGILFDEYAILATGDGEKIQMRRARQIHLIRHIGVLSAEMVRSSQAFNEKLSYFNARLELFQDGETLLDVEVREFGYVPEEDE